MSTIRRLADRANIWRRGILLVLLCIGIAGVAASNVPHEFLTRILFESRVVIEQYPNVGAMLFVLCAAFSAMLAFVSIAIIVPIAVYTWGAPMTLAMLWIGWIVGGILSYAAGSAFGRPVLKWAVSDAIMKKFEARIHADISFGLVLLFQLALPSEIPGYLLGIARYPFKKYLLALSIAELPYAAATVYLSEGLVESSVGSILIGGLLLIAISIWAAYWLHREASTAAQVASSSPQ